MHQSELALFAETFARALGPLAGALRSAQQGLSATEGERELPFSGEAFADACSALEPELTALLERVASERATVFVFGPAKSGKSTLLAALAGAPVSEVSILPSYPCVTRVRHGERASARLERFDGSGEVLNDATALPIVLQRAHHELAARAREAQAAGTLFDPARNLQRAVRRVERAGTAEALARAALELVECPPIHGPLFGGYAEMTIGEPDHARAGVFVVRASQLCDGAVFDGIEELLSTFERLVLVLNLDEAARELSPGGEAVPSPEREDPARLLAAFEELSTAEPMVRAIRSGSVVVLALDLLEAARARLGAPGVLAPPGRSRARFDDLEAELMRSLDAHEAFGALARSALRRAEELQAEAGELAQTPGLAELRSRRDAAEHERAGLERARAALARLAALDRARWASEDLFGSLRARLLERAARRARELTGELEPQLARVLEDWFARTASLTELIEAGLAPRLAAARNELARSSAQALREELRREGTSGLLSSGARAELDEARVDPVARLEACVEHVRATTEPVELRPLDVQAVPVRARLGQRLTWRSAGDVRRALFGPPEAPSSPLTSAEKEKRLGSEARAALGRSALERAGAILAEEARRLAHAEVEGLIAAFVEELHGHVTRALENLESKLASVTARAAELARSADALASLAPSCSRARAALAELSERCESTGVLVPAPRAGGFPARADVPRGSVHPSPVRADS